MSLGVTLLVAWSIAAAGWWVFACWLVATPGKRRVNRVRESRLSPSATQVHSPGSASFPTVSTRGRPIATDPKSQPYAFSAVPGRLSVFKPLPATSSPAERTVLASAIATFLPQLRPQDEMLIGVLDSEAAEWAPIFNAWRSQFPGAHILVRQHHKPVQRANPKVAWLEYLAEQAQGEFWLWSDADIIAPAGSLDALRGLLVDSDAGAVTSPYCVRQIRTAPGVLDALFVNAEFLPGARLLRRIGPVDFAFGAATIFRAEDLRKRVNWADLGAALADDYVLGQSLRPVRIAGELVETVTLECSWLAALRHYYRWQKTICWCRPVSFGALLAINPLAGWATLAALSPCESAIWIGLSTQWLGEILLAGVLFGIIGCRIPVQSWPTVALWPALRLACWLAVWLPFPVFWRGAMRRWTRPRHENSDDLGRAPGRLRE